MRRFRLTLIACAALCRSVAAEAAPPVETPPPHSGQTTIQIHRHELGDASFTEATEQVTWAAGWSFVRTFRVDASDYVLFLKMHTVEAQIMALNADGTLGPVVDAPVLERDVTSAEIFYPGGDPVLMLVQRRSGRIIMRGFQADGALGHVIDDQTLPKLVHKDVVEPFQVGGGWYLFASNRWHGGVNVIALDEDGSIKVLLAGVPAFEASWKPGWSHAAFYQTAFETYAIIYKTETPFGQTSGGRLGIKRVLPGGTLASGWHQGPDTWDLGFSQLRTVMLPTKLTPGEVFPAGSPPPHIDALWAYQIHSGDAQIVELTASGVGETLWTGNVGAGWTDLDLAVVGESLLVVKSNEEGRIPFDYQMVEVMRDAVSEGYADTTVGYQLAIMQSGRLIHAHAEGLRNREGELPMRSTDRMALGSTAKMFTAMIVLKMADDGYGGLSLDDRLLDHLPVLDSVPRESMYYLPKNKLPHPHFRDLRIIELLTHTAQLGSKKSKKALRLPRQLDNCTPDVLEDPLWFSTTQMRCDRRYQNGAYGFAGFVAMALAEVPIVKVENTVEWQNFCRTYWLNDILLGGVRCKTPDDETMAYYRACDDGDGCIDGFKLKTPDPTGFCVSNGWKASSEDLVTLLSAMRYGKVLSDSSTELLFATDLRDYVPGEGPGKAGSTRLGWDGRVKIKGELGLTKNGSSPGVTTQIWSMPRGVDIALLTNARCSGVENACPLMKKLVKKAFKAAIQ